MIPVGSRTARHAHREATHLLQQGNRRTVGRRFVIIVPDGDVHAEMPRIHRAYRLRCVKGQVDERRHGLRDQLNVIHVKRRLRRADAILKHKAGEVDFVRHAERRQRNCELLPGIGLQRAERKVTLRDVGCAAHLREAINLESLSAAGPAVDPETQAAIRRAVQVGMIYLQSLVWRRDGDAD